MRYQSGHAEVLAEGFTEQAAFGIANSGKAFKGLIDGLYSRKIEAAIRELATNAFDAHMAAGSIKPFELHIPTVLSPTFWIRDFGTGMSHDYMMRRFTVMFDSTKDGLKEEDASLVSPDQQVGCLGLGRMSFFTYTDTCTISIWQDGEMRVYSVFMGGDGVPQVVYAGATASDEPVGVKVEFAVKKKDYDAFRTAAIRVFKGFPVQPKGLTTDVREALAVEPLEIGSFWKSYPKSYLPDGGFYARQGCVLYPIDLVQIDENVIEPDEDEDEDGEAQLSEKYARFKGLDLTIVMDFPIGAVEFDLSRERLAYSEHTLRSLRSRWDEFTTDLDAVIKDAFTGSRSGWDRALTASRDSLRNLGPLFSQNSFFREAATVSEALFKGFPVQRSARSVDHYFFSAIKAKTSIHAIQPVYHSQYTDLPKKPDPSEIVLFYRDADAGRYINMRIGQYLTQHDKKWGFLFDKKRLTPSVYKKLGCPPIVRVSEIDDLPKEDRQKADATGATGGGGVFERVKIMADGGYRTPEKDEDVTDHLWSFLHRGHHVTMTDSDGLLLTQPSDMDVTDMMVVNTLSQGLGGQAISFVNLRSNDKPEKYAALPTFHDRYEKLAESFPKELVGRFVTIWNGFQWKGSIYDRAVETLEEDHERLIMDDLIRLERRYDFDRKNATKPLDGELAVICFNSGLEKLRNDLLRIAADMGMDVLSPDPKKLLSKRWEEALPQLHHVSGYSSNQTVRHRKASLRTLIRKNAQC